MYVWVHTGVHQFVLVYTGVHQFVWVSTGSCQSLFFGLYGSKSVCMFWVYTGIYQPLNAATH